MEHPPGSKFVDMRPYYAPLSVRAINGEEADADQDDAARLAMPWEQRCENVLADTFRGLHHINRERIKKDSVAKRWEYNHFNELTTYDYDELTRFVLSCHRWCVRGSIAPSSPRHIRIVLHPRDSRDGDSYWERHPTIQDAIEKFEGVEK